MATFYTVTEVAKKLGITRQTVYNLINRGVISYQKIANIDEKKQTRKFPRGFYAPKKVYDPVERKFKGQSEGNEEGSQSQVS